MGDVFEAVASVQQMLDIPENRASYTEDADLAIPYYRTDTVTFYARSPVEAESLWTSIKEDVNDLTRNWVAQTNTTETFVSTGD